MQIEIEHVCSDALHDASRHLTHEVDLREIADTAYDKQRNDQQRDEPSMRWSRSTKVPSKNSL